MKPWKCKSSEFLLDTKFFKVKRDFVELPHGEEKEWVYWHSNDSAMVLGLTPDKKLVMIRQYRYLVGDEVIEFPAGGLDDNEDIVEGAQREFEEETGFKCSNLLKIGSFYETYGQLNRQMHLFFTNKIEPSEQNLDSGERGFEDISVELVDFDKAVALAMENKMPDMGSAIAILLLKNKIERNEIKI